MVGQGKFFRLDTHQRRKLSTAPNLGVPRFSPRCRARPRSATPGAFLAAQRKRLAGYSSPA